MKCLKHCKLLEYSSIHDTKLKHKYDVCEELFVSSWLLNLFKLKIIPWLEASQHECSNYEMVKSEAMCAPFNIYQCLDACQYLFVPCLFVYS